MTAHHPGLDRSPRTMRRVVAFGLAVMLGSVLGASASILVLGERIRSRDELVANAAPPPTALVTVAAEERELRNEVVFRANVTAAAGAKLMLPTTVSGVVTRVYLKPGGRIAAGSTPVEVQGRPLIVLPGAFRFYRSLSVGDRGPDVEQLQNALRQLGLRPAGVRGVFGPDTAAALARLYGRAGYSPPYREITQPPETSPGGDQPSDPAACGQPDCPAGGPSPARSRRVVVAQPSELWVLSRLPRNVDDVVLRVDTVVTAEGTVLATAPAAVRLRGSVPEERAAEATPGTRVRVWDETGRAFPGAVIATAAETSEDRQGQGGVPVNLRLDDRHAKLSPDQSYKVTIEGDRTDGPVLSVPIAAVNQRPDGSHFVGVLLDASDTGGRASVRDADVIVGVQAEGWVEVTPTVEDRLREGSRVVIGLEAASGSPRG
jgi:hypothetical protein